MFMSKENSWRKPGTRACAVTMRSLSAIYVAKAETVVVDLAVVKGPATHRGRQGGVLRWCK